MGTSFIQQHETLSQNTGDSKLSYGENPNSLSHLGSDWYRVVTDRWTDKRTDSRTERITVANMRYNYASSRAQIPVNRVQPSTRRQHLHAEF